MILTDISIRKLISEGELRITPFHPDNIQPASLDCTLAPDYLTIDPNQEICCTKPIQYIPHSGSKQITIKPHEFVLATIQETIELPNDITAFVEGRSSIGRMGLFIQNAGWVDPGFRGQITLELFNASPSVMKLPIGQRICQLVFSTVTAPAERPYAGKYVGQKGAVGSRIHQDWQ